MKNNEELQKDISKLRVCLRYAINRLTDNDLSFAPDDLRHLWVNQASRIIKETEEVQE